MHFEVCLSQPREHIQSINNIAYLRGLFPETAFHPTVLDTLDKLTVQFLQKGGDAPEEVLQLLNWFEQGTRALGWSTYCSKCKDDRGAAGGGQGLPQDPAVWRGRRRRVHPTHRGVCCCVHLSRRLTSPQVYKFNFVYSAGGAVSMNIAGPQGETQLLQLNKVHWRVQQHNIAMPRLTCRTWAWPTCRSR